MDSGFLPPALAPLAPALLLAARVGGIVMVAPIYSARVVPLRVRAALLVLFTAVLLPTVRTDPAAVFGLVTLLQETLIGALVGLGAAVFVGGAEAAGEWLAVQTGLSGATTLDPLSTASTPTLGQLMNLTVTVVLLAVGGHLVMLEAVAATTEVAPLGSGFVAEAGAVMAVTAGSTLFALGLRLAAPVIATVLVANAALGVLARTAPQINLLLVAFPVQIGLGLLILAFSLPLAVTGFTNWPADYERVLERAFSAFAR